MKWYGISGSWRYDFPEVKKDVENETSKIIKRGDGVVTGGALGVDYFTTEVILKLDPKLTKLKIFLPPPLKIYLNHYQKQANEGVITKQQAKMLTTQLTNIQKINQKTIENLNHRTVNKRTYYLRNYAVVQKSDELIAFHVNKSLGTAHTINYAKKRGSAVKVYSYSTKKK